MSMFSTLEISGSALNAERQRAEVVAANMANAETTRTAAGVPYVRQHVVFAAGSGDPSFASQLGDSLPLSANANLAGASAPLLGQGSLLGAGNIAPGVHIAGVVQDTAPPLKRYDPSHPDADSEGYVSYPDINPLAEMVDLMGATRAYGLNSSAVQAEKSMISSSLELAK